MASRPLGTDQAESRPTLESRDLLGPAGIAAAMSVGLSWLLFFGMDDRDRGLFVGLWPPTILSFATYLSLRRIERRVESVTSPGETIRSVVESVMGG